MKNIDLCYSNIILALIEYIVTSGSFDKVINFDNFDKILMKKFGIKQNEADTVIDVIKKNLRSDTLKQIMRSQFIQKLYKLEEFRDYCEQLILSKNLKIDKEEEHLHFVVSLQKSLGKLYNSVEIKEINNPLIEIDQKYKIFNTLKEIVLDSQMFTLDMPIPGFLNIEYIEKIISTIDIKFVEKRNSNIFKYIFLNKHFQLNIQDFDLSNLEHFYKKLGFREKTEIKEITQKIFDYYNKCIFTNLEINSMELLISLWFLTKKLFSFYDFYLDNRNRKTQYYKTLLDTDSRFAEVTIEKMLKYDSKQGMLMQLVSAGLRNHKVYWRGYIDYLRQEYLKEEMFVQKQKLQTINKLSDEKSTDKIKPKRKKIKLNDHKYVIATRLHYKAEIENKSFPELCREAAERYVDKDGNDFDGRSLQNLFKSMRDQFGLEDLRKRAGILTFFK